MAGGILKTDWTTAPTKHVKAVGTRFAHRRLGPHGGVPVVLLNHWAANLYNFDPRLIEGLAADRPVFALDYRGIGSSGGKAPLSVEDMSLDVIAVVRALGPDHVDLIGFSLGGFLSGRFGSTIPSRSHLRSSGNRAAGRCSSRTAPS